MKSTLLQQNVSMRKQEVCFISRISLFRIYFLADREVQRILLELLNQMDGFDQTINVKVNDHFIIKKIHFFKFRL